MKNQKINTASVLIFLLVIFVLSVSSKSNIGGVIDHFKVGDVVYSILSPTDFYKLHGSGWMLMDGAALPTPNNQKTDLEQFYGFKKTPDARGVFIRGMNVNNDGLDPDKNRAVGSYQPDGVGNHAHDFNDNYFAESWSNFLKPQAGSGKTDGDNGLISIRSTTDNFGPSIISETRPKNITLYTYIKVDE